MRHALASACVAAVWHGHVETYQLLDVWHGSVLLLGAKIAVMMPEDLDFSWFFFSSSLLGVRNQHLCLLQAALGDPDVHEVLYDATLQYVLVVLAPSSSQQHLIAVQPDYAKLKDALSSKTTAGVIVTCEGK